MVVAGCRIDAFMASDETELEKMIKPHVDSLRQVGMKSDDVDVRVEDAAFSWTRAGQGEI